MSRSSARFVVGADGDGTRAGQHLRRELGSWSTGSASHGREGPGRGCRRASHPTIAKPGPWGTSAAVVLSWGYFLYTGVTNQLFSLFGIANQLLAAIALTVATTLLIKSGRAKWAWVPGIPLVWDVAVTMTASWQKVFSSDPRIGFFAQRDKYATALGAGEVLAPAKDLGDMHAVVTNSTVDGVLAAFFGLLVVVVLLDAARIWVTILRGRACR